MNQSSKVIDLTERIAANDTVTERWDRHGSTSVGYSGNSQRDRTRPRRARQPSQLDRAFAAICAASSDELGEVERSNSFDEWKEALHREALVAIETPAASRQILGILLAAARQKDVSDFQPSALGAFRAITNTLRRPGVALLEVQTVIKYLKIAGLTAFLPLEAGNISESLEAELDRFLEDLVAKHS
jgi:hypothetical protein